jgi:hypothetical protein
MKITTIAAHGRVDPSCEEEAVGPEPQNFVLSPGIRYRRAGRFVQILAKSAIYR